MSTWPASRRNGVDDFTVTYVVITLPAKISCQVSVSFVLPLKARPPSGGIVEGIKIKTRESKKVSMWVEEKER